jgi:transcriptional regulator GlxA family with amidase domain
VLAEPRTPIDIAALCLATAVTGRVMRKAFHRVRGLPPHRCLRLLKLFQARQALASARNRSVTVTEIALALGFIELGRFSVEYRKTFGERPSETLRQSDAPPRPCLRQLAG